MRTSVNLLIIFGTCVSLCKAQAGSFKGLVKDEKEDVIDHALLIITGTTDHPDTVYSSPDGSFVFDGIAPDTYTVVCRKDGYDGFHATGLEVDPHKITFMNISLAKTSSEGSRKRKKKKRT